MLPSAAALPDSLFEHPESGFPSVASYSVLGLKKVKVICRPGSVTDRETMAKGFGEIGLGRLYGIVHGFASCKMGGDGRGEGAACAMCVGGINELPLEHIEKIPVLEQIGGSLRRQMAAFDQHILAAEFVNDFGCAACIRERLDF